MAIIIEKDSSPATPEGLAAELEDIEKRYSKDIETLHRKLDDALCDALRSLGFGDAVDIFDSIYKYYA